MSRKPFAAVTHVGITVYDFEKMLDFYLRLFDFHVSDQKTMDNGRKVAFLTMDPNEHHQLVLGSGRPENIDFNPVNQISFRTENLKSVKRYWKLCVQDPEVEIQRTITHGNAWSIYFFDPEQNRLEIYADTPWQVTQPYVVDMDFNKSNQEIYSLTKSIVHSEDYFEPLVDWRRKTASVMGLDDWPIRD